MIQSLRSRFASFAPRLNTLVTPMRRRDSTRAASRCGRSRSTGVDRKVLRTALGGAGVDPGRRLGPHRVASCRVSSPTRRPDSKHLDASRCNRLGAIVSVRSRDPAATVRSKNSSRPLGIEGADRRAHVQHMAYEQLPIVEVGLDGLLLDLDKDVA